MWITVLSSLALNIRRAVVAHVRSQRGQHGELALASWHWTIREFLEARPRYIRDAHARSEDREKLPGNIFWKNAPVCIASHGRTSRILDRRHPIGRATRIIVDVWDAAMKLGVAHALSKSVGSPRCWNQNSALCSGIDWPSLRLALCSPPSTTWLQNDPPRANPVAEATVLITSRTAVHFGSKSLA